MDLKCPGLTIAISFFVLLLPLRSFGQEVIYVARHADPPQRLRLHAPIRDETPLSEAGRRQATKLAERLKDAEVAAIYTSKTARAIQTAEPLAKLLGLDINEWPRRDIEGLVEQIQQKHQRDRVLIVGHFTNIPSVLRLLGHTDSVKIKPRIRNDLYLVVPRVGSLPVVIHLHY